jgi:hypothetical protein
MGIIRKTDRYAGHAATVYVTIDGIMHETFYVKSYEVTVEKQKAEVRCLGDRMVKHKTVGMSGTGTMTIDYVTSYYRQMVKQYHDTGRDVYFDMTFVNDDPESTMGVNAVKIFDANLDKITLSKADAGSTDALDEEIAFTFDDWEPLSHFKEQP